MLLAKVCYYILCGKYFQPTDVF